MSSTNQSGTTNTQIEHFFSPQTVIGRFVARRTMRSAAFLAALFGIVVAAKASGFASAYPTAASRVKIAASFSSNIGLRAVLGAPSHIASVAGFTTWNASGPIMIVGSIWALLLATRNFRGEENAGRWEMLLSGQTTARRAAANVLAGLAASLAVLYVVAALAFITIGRIHTVNFSVSAALFLALVCVSSAAVFMTMGALASQLMPTRSRAAGLATGVFGFFFLLRAFADTTSAHWLLYFTPLGWTEKMQPLYNSQPKWLIPIIGLVILLVALTIYLAGRRDLGASTFVDKDSAKPHTKLLSGPLLATIRLTRSASVAWLAGVATMAFFFGLLAKSASQALSQSSGLNREFGRVLHVSQSIGATAFLGFIFFLLMIVIMSYTASAVSAMREDEAEGLLDNLLVRRVSRLQWLRDRLSIVIIVIVIASLLSTIGSWIGANSQHAGVAYHTLFLAGVNTISPAVFILGIAVFAMGVIPRLTSVLSYGVIVLSFLISLIGSGIKLNHWILDTSILQHVSLAPAVKPNWSSGIMLICIGLIMALIGSLVFNRRDLAAE